jgi:hypothetical protein
VTDLRVVIDEISNFQSWALPFPTPYRSRLQGVWGGPTCAERSLASGSARTIESGENNTTRRPDIDDETRMFCD